MPEYENEEIKSFKDIKVTFPTEEDYKDFAKLIEQNLTDKTKCISFPKKVRGEKSHFRYEDFDES